MGGARELRPHGLHAACQRHFLAGVSVLGTLALYYPRVHEPDEIERRLVDVITRTAGIAIERKRGEEGLRTHSERLRLLWETAAVLLTADDSETLIRALVARIAPHLGLDVVLSYAATEGDDALTLSFHSGVTAEQASEYARIAPDHALAGDVIRTHEPLALSHVQSSNRPAEHSQKAMGLRAYACFPLNADERLLGTLGVGSRERDEFEVDELEFMRTVTLYMRCLRAATLGAPAGAMQIARKRFHRVAPHELAIRSRRCATACTSCAWPLPTRPRSGERARSWSGSCRTW